MNKNAINDIYGWVCYEDTDSLKSPPKTNNYSLGYIKYFKREWAVITSKLKRYPKVMAMPLVPIDRSNEPKVKRIKF